MKKIIVHDGIFHADDVCAVALYALLTGDNFKVVRTRNEKEMEDADYIFDVGGTYDGEKFFDHHQKEVPLYDNGIKYAACGLVLKHFCNDESFEEFLLNKGLYAVQAHDNGQELPETVSDENPFTFVNAMNESWKKSIYGIGQDKLFEQAVVITETIIQHQMDAYEAIEEVEYALHESSENRPSYHILYFDKFIPWQGTVVKYNSQVEEGYRVTLVVFRQKENDYRVQVVPKEMGKFDSWINLDETKAKKFDDLVFFHKACFLAGFKSKDSAIEFAHLMTTKKFEG